MSVNQGAPLTPSDDPTDQLSRMVDEFENGTENTQPDDDEPEQAPAGGRTPDNVYGELSRKQKKFQAETSSKLDQLQASIQTALAAFQGMLPGQQTQQAAPASSYNPQDPETWTVDQLLASRDNVFQTNDPSAVVAFNALVARKSAEEAIRSEVARSQRQSQTQADTAEYTKLALERYGSLGLRDKSSRFYQEVQAEIAKRQSWGQVPPSVSYDAAAFVADKLGLKPGGQTPRGSAGLAGGRTSAPVGAGGSRVDNSAIDARIAQMEEISGHKFDEAARERVRANFQMLKENAHLYGVK